ncbi:MAG: hypothetical protein QM703_26345 [Gemmatales bacterium]
MRFAQENTRRSPQQLLLWWNVVGRLLWAILFLIHIVPLVSVGNKLLVSASLTLVLSFIAILGIMTVALLKAIDARVLRFQLSFQKWCTLIVLGLFFHGDVVANQLPDLMVAESTMVVLVAIVCSSRRLHHLVVKLILSTSLQVRETLYVWMEELAPTPLIPVYALLSSPRPPPAR